MGNLLFAAHVMLAAIITFGGTLQLIPYIRKRALTFHRWNGRLYILTALAISIGGLYLVWVRGSTSSFGGAVGISLNAGLIMLFALLAWRHARAGNIITHRRWALRTFIVVSGVWFFRVGMMLWIFLNGGPVGLGENFDGPFIIFWSFGSYLLPLAVLELYLLAQKHDNPMGRFAMAATLFVITIGMGLGIFMAAMGLWLPNL